MYQRFIAVGRLGRDPQIATVAGGTRVATLSLATSDYVKGEERTEWHRVVVWDEKLVELLEKQAAKGTMLAVEGQIRTRRYEKDGREHSVTEVVLDRFNSRLKLLRGRSGEARAPEPEPVPAGAEEVPRQRSGRRAGPAPVELDDDLPF